MREAEASVQADLEEQTQGIQGIMPGTHNSNLGSFLNATSTKISQLPNSSSSDEWAIVIANRDGSLEAWALRTNDPDGLVWAVSRRNGLLVFFGLALGASLTFGYLAYL